MPGKKMDERPVEVGHRKFRSYYGDLREMADVVRAEVPDPGAGDPSREAARMEQRKRMIERRLDRGYAGTPEDIRIAAGLRDYGAEVDAG